MGADMFQTFPTWHDWEGILERTTLLVAARPGFDLEPPPEFEGRNVPVEVLAAPEVDVSATALREDLREGRDVGDRVSPAVRAYIEDHGLYGRAGASNVMLS
jgi:nicotinate-nucleotide adenylyltransferase